jgi:hypothetical protein
VIDTGPIVRQLAILLLLPGVPAQPKLLAQDTDGGLPALSKGWTDPEKAQFRDCVFHIADSSRENTTQLTADFSACAFFEERQHWMTLHPEAARRKENSDKSRKCFDKHPLPKNGTPEDFHAAFDLCMCKAYGLPKPKQ